MSSITVNRISYAGWPDCYQITDGTVDAVVTSLVGPRIIRCGFCGENNFFAEISDQVGLSGGTNWRIYGGHRLWHSPEELARTYNPDNGPIEVTVLNNGIHVKQPVESNSGIIKEMHITLESSNHSFRVAHNLTNTGVWPVNLAPWAISVMRTGGIGFIPQYREKAGEGLLHNRLLALWPYTDMNDSRVTWGARYILLRQDPQKTNAFKIGLSVPEGWGAYVYEGQLFLKQFFYNIKGTYPDGGVNVELYTNNRFLELESLGPLTTLAPGKNIEYVESWRLFKDIGPVNNETEAEQAISKCLPGK